MSSWLRASSLAWSCDLDQSREAQERALRCCRRTYKIISTSGQYCPLIFFFLFAGHIINSREVLTCCSLTDLRRSRGGAYTSQYPHWQWRAVDVATAMILSILVVKPQFLFMFGLLTDSIVHPCSSRSLGETGSDASEKNPRTTSVLSRFFTA